MMGKSLTWQVENVLSYDKVFADKHSVSVLLGQSALETTGSELRGGREDLKAEDPDRANLNFATGSSTDGKQTASGGPWADYRLASLFARASYSYDDRYMIQATIRSDGSSRFGANKRFATFPSVSVGWNIRNEHFMEGRAQWLSAFKLRASWGQNGNDQSLGAFAYTVLTSGGNHVFGSGAVGNESIIIGTKASGTPNPNLKWEASEQTDIGLDLGFLSGSLNVTVDYYKKRTNGMIIRIPINTYVGTAEPFGNVGKMDNSGFEIEANYRLRAGEFNFYVGANATYLKNNVVNLGNATGILPLDNFGTAGLITRAQNGQPFPYFFGLKTAGIFQNQAEIDSFNENGKTPIMNPDTNQQEVDDDGNLMWNYPQPNVVPGDVRFVDINKDGKIDDNDRTKIGKGTPDWMYGFNVGFEWKGIDFNMIWQGVAGADVFDGTYRHGAFASGNMPRYMLDRWTGEGSSDKLPRFSFSGTSTNWLSSDLYIKDGSYLRLKNVTLGYTLPITWTSKAFISRLRIYVSASNLLTFTKYDGFDPEIASGGTSLGVDRGVYPQARTFYFGVNLNF